MNGSMPSPHGRKLTALLNNDKLPSTDQPRVSAAIERYEAWMKTLDEIDGGRDEILTAFIHALNDYKRFIEINLIFDSPNDFLYRQKGQLKLDNSILEEFIPRLFDERLAPGLKRLRNNERGPMKCFSHLSFGSPFLKLSDGGISIRTKDQDFSVTKTYRLRIDDVPSSDEPYQMTLHVSYFATEIKTNLDKTMFQEASMSAGALKSAVPGARYILICEFIDMPPINTQLTPIDEVIILRKAKRINASIRSRFSTVEGRIAHRADYVKYLDENPFHVECFQRFMSHLRACFPEEGGESESVFITRGYF